MSDQDRRYWDCLDEAMDASHGGRTQEALEWLERALQARPDGAEAHNGRGEILWDEGRLDDALAEFELAVKADPKFVPSHLNRIELLLEEYGALEQAVEQCDRLLSGVDDLPRLDRGTEGEVHYLKSKAYFYQDDLEGALFLVRRALKTGGEQSAPRAFEGQILFELGRFEEARRQLERAVAIDPESAHAVYHLGLVLERLGEHEASSRALARANALEPESYPLPVPIGEHEFESAAAEALENVPRSIREHIEGVPLLIEDFPGEELMRHENLSPQILGLFLGVPRTEAAVTDQPTDLTRIFLFKKNLEKVCRDRDDLVEQIQITVKHEVGHYLGLDEEQLERLGLA